MMSSQSRARELGREAVEFVFLLRLRRRRCVCGVCRWCIGMRWRRLIQSPLPTDQVRFWRRRHEVLVRWRGIDIDKRLDIDRLPNSNVPIARPLYLP